ncbi:MAG: BCCT family transporter [Methyloceanibacter sp.]
MPEGRNSGAVEEHHCVVGVPTGAKVAVAIFVLATIGWPTLAEESFTAVRDAISHSAGLFYGFVASLALILCLIMPLGPWGALRLGSDHEKPEFSRAAWTAMLFAAGMGIGLVFWSIAEPLTHYADNPLLAYWGDNPSDRVRARVAMEITFFHWGLMPWALYALAGVIFAYFSFRRSAPLTVRSAMRPLFGNAVGRWPGKVADVFVIVATVFGLATSLGLGAAQINAGLDRLFGWDVTIEHKVLLVAAISAAAVLSVSSGLERGIRFLSLANVWLAILVLSAVLIAAPLEPIWRNLTMRIADYLVNLPWLTFQTARDDTNWAAAWTTFYWGWWISWTPFVGLFIARISRGRTIREFVLGALLVPTGITFVWLSIMGGAAIAAGRADPGIIEIARETPALSLYAMIDLLLSGRIATVVAALATLLVAIFFVTSADSGALVVTAMQSGDHESPPILERVQWGVGIGAVAAALLVAGGLGALQAVAVAAALPFAVILVLLTFGFVLALYSDTAQAKANLRDKSEVGSEAPVLALPAWGDQVTADHTDHAKAKTASAWYKSPTWKAIRRHRLTQEPNCRLCGEEGRTVAAKHVAHIEPHGDDWALFARYDNTQSLCARHRKRQTRH